MLSEYNLADPLTKKMKSKLLDDLLLTGKINHPVNLWIIHEKSQFHFPKKYRNTNVIGVTHRDEMPTQE